MSVVSFRTGNRFKVKNDPKGVVYTFEFISFKGRKSYVHCTEESGRTKVIEADLFDLEHV